MELQITHVDPKALVANPHNPRQIKVNKHSEEMLVASVMALGILQPPCVSPQTDGGNGYVINAGHRRVKAAIKAGLKEIPVYVMEAANDNGYLRGLAENYVREQFHPVDLWRGILKLEELGWNEASICLSLGLNVRTMNVLKLLGLIHEPMLNQMAKGDMPREQELRQIASAPLEEQADVWKQHKPSKGNSADWYSIARALEKRWYYARDAKFDDELAALYGIVWQEDLFAPADEDSRHTTDRDAFISAQHEWMMRNLPSNGEILEVQEHHRSPNLPKNAQRVWGDPLEGDRIGYYLDPYDGEVETIHYRLPQKDVSVPANGETGTPTPRPPLTQKGTRLIGDFKTEALQAALMEGTIETDLLILLLVIGYAATNVSVSGTGFMSDSGFRSSARETVATLFTDEGEPEFEMETLRTAACSILANLFSCRDDRTNSGAVADLAGKIVEADRYLPNMGREEFVKCMSRASIEDLAIERGLEVKARLKDTREDLLKSLEYVGFVHRQAVFALTRSLKDALQLKDSLSEIGGDDVFEDGFEDDCFDRDDEETTFEAVPDDLQVIETHEPEQLAA